ncbi:MAG: hypothetical protein ACD_16C00008G0004 [uncultured bacterium]|nr:MAG: hypothetical protein ACD_16C00008G0004 [uncultured bacterium]OFW69076.1 MAG: hypothetical protein A2X70_01990 [Alphaproteobacteria bacterium GWC2_42_16]OFW73934.1 MAG: hypothetical protein A2Z80_03005 [Alphaproteobacteria bacterium GWA2_41_27]OFW82472.1 MAG: hypothetical protein A3E50_06930 [Alphaproteobacteria bacterium RIFCSPHIGHO2_12_FULL_42_100]OFW86609.1 MAG: hypothetical protein A2W06_08035 [Alphaproteobacteria bacterium RBG_16_42_14]OFW91483.1 MAG: hypothetical protein A3C41_075
MNKNQKQEPLQEMIQVLKGDYNFPVKLWVWGKVVKEWAGIIVGSAIFFLVALFIVLSIKGERQNTKSEMNAKQAVVSTLPIKDIVAFLATTQRSINKRQEIFESLIKTMESYGNEKLDKKSLEIKISTLSSIFRTCNTLRGRFINEFTRAKNPFEDPEVARSFNKLIENPDDFFNENNKVLNFQRDNEEWGKLCDLCQNEVKKANNELVQLLNEEGRQ